MRAIIKARFGRPFYATSAPRAAVLYIFLTLVCVPTAVPFAYAQSNSSIQSKSRFEREKQMPLNILKDQAAIWTSPLHMKPKPMLFVIPMGVASAITAVKDDDILDALGPDADRERISGYISHAGTLPVNYGIATGTYVIGRLTKKPYLAETGLLTIEALTDTGIMTGIAKISADRKRPIDGGNGEFLNGGRSFFSGHASLSFTTATVIASRYTHKPWVKYPAYLMAAAVSASRVTARKHFVSEVLVGGTVGFLIGKYVTHRGQSDFLSNVSFAPISNPRTQTFGMRISFTGF